MKTVVYKQTLNNEAPPGTYYLFKSKGPTGKAKGWLAIGDKKDDARIKGPDGKREAISIHSYNPHWSKGCFTTGDQEENYTKLNELKKAIGGDLDKKDADVRIVIEPR